MTDTQVRRHFSIDIETLALCPSAKIVSIAAVEFFPDTLTVAEPLARFCALVDVDAQPGRSTSRDTLAFWNALPAVKALDLTGKPRLPLADALNALEAHLGAQPIVWAHPMSFDLVILANAYAYVGGYASGGEPAIPTSTEMSPWGRRDGRDLRTLSCALEMVGIPVDDLVGKWLKGRPDSHGALSDALAQANYIVDCVRRLRAFIPRDTAAAVRSMLP